MPLDGQVSTLATRIAQEIKAVREQLAGYVPTTRIIGAGTGITGGGDLTANRSLAVAYGTTAGTAAQGNDARLSDTRAPTDGSVTDGKVAASAAIAESKLALASDAAIDVPSRRTLGSGTLQAAPGSRVAALEARNPNDLGSCRRVQRSAQNITSQTNTSVTFTHTLSSTEHVQVLNATTLRILTAGLWSITAAVQLGASSISNQGFWIGSPDYLTRYASEGGHSFAANTFPTLTLAVVIQLAANTDLCASVWINGTSPATSPGYDLVHLAATLLRRS